MGGVGTDFSLPLPFFLLINLPGLFQLPGPPKDNGPWCVHRPDVLRTSFISFCFIFNTLPLAVRNLEPPVSLWEAVKWSLMMCMLHSKKSVRHTAQVTGYPSHSTTQKTEQSSCLQTLREWWWKGNRWSGNTEPHREHASALAHAGGWHWLLLIHHKHNWE